MKRVRFASQGRALLSGVLLSLLWTTVPLTGWAQGPAVTPSPAAMRAEFVGENQRQKGAVHYYSDSELQGFRVTPIDGLLVDSQGKPFSSFIGQAALYVITVEGELYLSAFSKQGWIHHSSLSRGMPVLAAGQMAVRNGRILAVDLESGHYRQPKEYLGFLKRFLLDRGIEVEQITFGEGAGPRWPESCSSFLTPLDPRFH